MKHKTKKTLSKRIKITGTGKLLRGKIRNSHLKIKLTSSRRGRKARLSTISSGMARTIRKMI